MKEITKEELRERYFSRTNEQLAKELDISKPTLMRILRANGINLKGKGYGKAKIFVKEM